MLTSSSCFRVSWFLRLRQRKKRQPADQLQVLLLSLPVQQVLCSAVWLQGKTNEKSWIPNVAGLLRWQEIFQICLNVKSAVQTKGILKLRLKFLGLDGFVALNYIEQAFAACFTWELAWWEEYFSKYNCMGGFPQGIYSMLIPLFIGGHWLEYVIVVLL